MNTTKTSSKTKKVKVNPDLHRKAQHARQNLEGFIKKQGGIRCRNRQELDLAVDSLLIQGTISKASFELESLVKKAKKLGLFPSGKLILQKV
jgi:hypothetical protein